MRKHGGFSEGIDHCNYCDIKYSKIAHSQEPLHINHDYQTCKQQSKI